MFRIKIDGTAAGFIKSFDNTFDENSIIVTKNFHLMAGQVVTSDYSDMNSICASYGGIIGYESWFSAHLIMPD